MAMNPEDLRLRSGSRQPRSETRGQRTGADWHQKRRERLFSHEQLQAALQGLGMPVKVKA